MINIVDNVLYSKKGEFNVENLDYVYSDTEKVLFVDVKKLVVGYNGKDVVVETAVKENKVKELDEYTKLIRDELKKDKKWVIIDKSTIINKKRMKQFGKLLDENGQCYILRFVDGNIIAREYIPYETRQFLKGQKVLPGVLRAPSEESER